MTLLHRIEVEVPEPLRTEPAEVLAARARLLLVVAEVQAGRLSRRAGAGALGLDLAAFLRAAAPFGLSVLDYDTDDLADELREVRSR